MRNRQYHASVVGALAIWLFAAPACLKAQYFGQNIVRWETFDFQVLETENFDIHYYEREREATVQAGRLAERWHTRLSKVLGHQLSPNQPIIFYDSHPAFRATTAIPGAIGETVGGVTEAARRRLIMPFAGPFAETDHVLGHELVHAFQFDIAAAAGPGEGAGLRGVFALPLWFVEGMAEYLSLGPVDPLTAMWLRDAVRREAVPTIRQMGHPRYFPYRYGHAFWAYVGGRYGDEVIGRILRVAARTGNAEGAITSVLKISSEELSKDWHRALSDEYEPVLQATVLPTEQARLLIEADERRARGLNLGPVLSPDGTRVVFFSERELFSIEMFLADAQTGQVIRKITETAIDPHFESLQFVNSAGVWSADGSRFAFPSVARGQPEISIYDIERGRIERNIRLEQFGEIFNPTWSPDGRYMAFSAIVGGFMDLAMVDLETGDVRRLTGDSFADLHPAWSPDGRRIAFVTDRFTSDLEALSFGDYRLAMLDVETGRIEALPAFPEGKHINPQWSRDGRSLYFVSDRHGVPNVYRLALGERRFFQVTNLQTGVSGISRLSPALSVAGDADRLAYSAFSNGNYSIFVMEEAAQLAGQPPTDVLARHTAGLLPPRERAPAPIVAELLERPRLGLIGPQDFRVSPYRASLGLDFIAPPQIAVGASNFGGLVAGGTALYFSDLLGHHNLVTAFQTATTVEGQHFYRNLSGIAGYYNQRTRWTWGFTGGQIPFLTGGYGRTTALVDGEPAVVEQAVRFWQINREVNTLAAYPFSRAQRVEFSGGYRHVGFAADATVRAFSPVTGRLLVDERRDLPTPDSLNLGTAATALVYDTSLFGGTSPVRGQRYRFEFGSAGGTVNYGSVLADYRRYFMPVRPFTLAGRILHFGRYLGDAEDPRLQDLFVGYPWLVRGYSPGSFTPQECPPTEVGRCPAFDQLLGSRMAVANAELRIPLLGALGVIPSRGFPPVEFAPFYDAGYAWVSQDRARALDRPRTVVRSWGASLRFNLLGFAIGQVSYSRPVDRPLQTSVWEFTFAPGF